MRLNKEVNNEEIAKKSGKHMGKYLLGILFIFISISLIRNFHHYSNFLYILPGYYAKMYCSCYYIIKQDQNFCHNYSKQYIPISEFEHDKEKKEVNVKAGLFHLFQRSQTAYFINEKYGCKLKPIQGVSD